MRQSAKPLAVAAAGALVAAMLTGCGGSGGNSSPGATSPRTVPAPGATTAPTPALARFYGQKLSWTTCHSKDQCSWLTVPLDYQHPAGATIKLALLRVPAGDSSHRVGSLVVNPGGPGASGVDYAAQASQAFRAPLREHFDIVGFDPRGVGRSDPVDCLTDDQLDHYVAEDPAPQTRAEKQTVIDWNKKMAAGCATSPVGAHISTVEAARDMDVLRAALGESTLDYFGASYGTKLGTTYADLYPQRVGRFVLDGAVDPTLHNVDLDLQQAAGFETALRSYVQDCVSSAPCFLGSTVDAGLARIKSFLAQVAQHPLPTNGSRQLESGNAFYGIVLPLYVRSYWHYLTEGLKQAFAGDGSLLLALSDAYTSRSDRGYTDNSMEAEYDIGCLDDRSGLRPSQVAAALPRFERASPTLGDAFAWGATSCASFTAHASEPAPPIGAPGANPIVVIGTTRDPATPLRWAQHLASLLKSGVLVTRNGDGHTGYNAGNTCVDNAVEGYLVAGTVPKNGLSC
jgi:pimeloyl-ACP methyl ester carboxylesterase